MVSPILRLLRKRLTRELCLLAALPLPVERRVAIERRLRGGEEFRKLQQADAVIVSYGKAGRTWLRVLLSRVFQVRHGFSERHLIGFDNLHWRNPAVPRLLFTHDNYLRDFTGHHDDKRDYYDSKVVLLVRHPADTAVSQYFQWKYRMRDRKKRLNAYPADDSAQAVRDFVMGPAGLPRVVDFMNAWAREAPRLRDFMLLRYEDLRRDTEGELARVLAMIGTPASPQELAEAVRFASVENMRRMEASRTFWLSGSRMTTRDRTNPDAYKVRRAKVGGWRDYLEAGQVAEVESYLAATLDPLFGYLPDAGEADREIAPVTRPVTTAAAGGASE